MNELLRQSPLCQVGCATLPEAFTLLPSLGDDRPGRLDFQKTSLVPSHWTGQDNWTSYKPPELSTGSCVVSETALSRFHPFVFLSGIWRE